MSHKAKLLDLLKDVEKKIEDAKRAFHDVTLWNEQLIHYDDKQPAGVTHNDLIERAFYKLKEGIEELDEPNKLMPLPIPDEEKKLLPSEDDDDDDGDS